MRTWRFGALALLGLAAACGPALTPLDPVTSQYLDYDVTRYAPTWVIVLVVDDAATPDAAALRAKAVEALRAALHFAVYSQNTCLPDDPARWYGGELRVVLARPSAPDEEALLGWLDVPALQWTSHLLTHEDADAVADAAEVALESRLASPGEVFEPLRAARRALELVALHRPPSTADETALAGSLGNPDGTYVRLFVAGTREDEGLADVATLVPDALVQEWRGTVVAPSDEGDAACGLYPVGDTPLQQWAALTYSQLLAWPCDVAFVWEDALHSCGANCNSYPISVDPDGAASCTVEVEQWDLSECDPALGRRDPEAGPLLVTSGDAEVRLCAVVQLAGADLEACRHTLACSGCDPGFCVTEVPELRQEQYCSPDELYDFPLRFIGGAVEEGVHRLHVVCLAESPP